MGDVVARVVKLNMLVWFGGQAGEDEGVVKPTGSEYQGSEESTYAADFCRVMPLTGRSHEVRFLKCSLGCDEMSRVNLPDSEAG